MLRHGKVDRRVTNWVDHNEIDDEGGDEGLDHAAALRRNGEGVQSQSGENRVKSGCWQKRPANWPWRR